MPGFYPERAGARPDVPSHTKKTKAIWKATASVLAAATSLGVGGEGPTPLRPAHAARIMPQASPAVEVEVRHLASMEAYLADLGTFYTNINLGNFYETVAERDRQANAAAKLALHGGHSTGRCGADIACFLECTKGHESHGDYNAVSPGGKYRGAYQFDQNTWDSNAAASGREDLVGQDPANAAPADQDQITIDTYGRRGNQPWGGRC